MSISCFFGCPGSGKSSVLTLIAQKELRKIHKGKSKYSYVYTNFPCTGCLCLDFQQLGNFYFHDSLIILDELTLSADSRDFKKFSQQAKEFFTLHRHFGIDIIFSVQDFSRVDKTIRENVVNLYYVSSLIWFSVVRPIYRTICINDMVGDLIMGYRFPSFFELFTGGFHVYPIFRAWKYYNSFDKYGFDLLPAPPDDIWP